MPMKNSNDTIGNRFRDLPVCSAVPQPLHHRVGIAVNYTNYRKETRFKTIDGVKA
jgi:hypothetical protein